MAKSKKAVRKKPTRAQKVAATDPETVPSSFESPESSTITRAVHYDDGLMHVTFKRQGQPTYAFPNISQTLWKEFICAASKGGFFTLRIRPHYKGTMIVCDGERVLR